MRRITTATADEDLFGTDRPGFTDGDPGLSIPPTQLNADAFNHYQEEVCRAVEGNGDTCVAEGGTPNYFQLDDAIQSMAQIMVAEDDDSRFILDGLNFTSSTVSLIVTLNGGQYVFDGRRYVVTSDKLNDGGFDSWTLTASRDHYFYIAPENPASPGTPPDRATVYITRQDVATGATAPATPGGTLLFAMVPTGVSGVVQNSIVYYDRGPSLMTSSGYGVRLYRTVGSSGGVSGSTASLIPIAPRNVDLGAATLPYDEEGAYYDNLYVTEVHQRDGYSSVATQNGSRVYIFRATTLAGTEHNQSLADLADYTEPVSILWEIKGSAFSTTDATDCYSFIYRAHAHLDAGAWELDGSFTMEYEDGNGAIAAAVSATVTVSGDDVLLNLIGHTTDTMRWFVKVEQITCGV